MADETQQRHFSPVLEHDAQAGALARGPGPMGKLTKNLTVWLDEETATAFERLATEHGASPDRLLKNFIYEEVHGRSYDDIESEHDALVKQRRAERFGKRAVAAPHERVTNGVGSAQA